MPGEKKGKVKRLKDPAIVGFIINLAVTNDKGEYWIESFDVYLKPCAGLADITEAARQVALVSFDDRPGERPLTVAEFKELGLIFESNDLHRVLQ